MAVSTLSHKRNETAERPAPRTWTVTEYTEDGPVVHRNVGEQDAVAYIAAMARGKRLPRPTEQQERLAA